MTMLHPRILALLPWAAVMTGFFSITYQLTWDRVLRDYFGGDNISQTIVISAFMSGLGFGAYLFRKQRMNPVLQYALLEIVLGVYALASIAFFSYALDMSTSALGLSEDNWRIVNAAIVMVLILLPSVFMGGTFPALMRILSSCKAQDSVNVEIYYSLNVLGAVLGVIGTTFYLLPTFDADLYVRAIGILNVLLGLTFFFLRRTVSNPSGEAGPDFEAYDRKWYVLSFLSGFIVIFWEFLILRHLGFNNPGAPYNFPLLLIFVLLLLTLGGFGVNVLRRTWSPYKMVSFAFLGGGAGMILATWAAQGLLKSHLLMPLYQHPFQLLAYLGVLTVPVLIPLSLAFPALLSQARTHDSRSSYIGLLYVFNSSGALLAGVLFGLCIDGLSLYDMIVALALVCFVTWTIYATRGNRRNFVAAGAALSLYICLRLLNVAIPTFNVAIPTAWNNGLSENAFHHMGNVVNGVTGQVSIGWYDAPENGGALLVNGQGMGSVPQEPINARTVMLALSIVPEPKSVLQLGAGAATTVRYFRDINGAASYTLVDWSHELASLLKMHRRAEILDLNRLDVDLKTADANVFMSVGQSKYDVIFDALMHPHHVGANAVRNVSFFAKVERALEVPWGEPGIYVVGALGAKFERVGHTLKKVFRNVVYYPEVGVIIASNRSTEPWRRGSGLGDANVQNLYAKLGTAAKMNYEEYLHALESGHSFPDSPAQIARPLDFSYEYNLSSWTNP